MSLRRFALGGLALTLGLGGLLVHRASSRKVVGLPSATDTAMVSKSIAYFESRLRLDPDNPMVAGQLVNRYIIRFNNAADLSDIERAESLAQHALPLAADRSSATARISGILLMQHKFGPAYEMARDAVAADTGSSEARGALMEAAIAAGAYAVADSQAGRLDSRTVSGLVRRAQWLDVQGKTAVAYGMMKQACRELQSAAANPSIVAWCLTQLGVMDHSLRGPDDAEATLRRALAAQPGYRGAVEQLANIALARGRTREAESLYRQILSDAHPDLYLRFAEVERAVGAEAEAKRAEAKFVALAGAPRREALFGNPLALYLAERGDQAALDSALALAHREVARRPTIESFDLLSWVLYRRGEIGAALGASDRAGQWGSPTPTMMYHRARILEASGQLGAAQSLMDRARATPTLLASHARTGV